MRYIIFLGVLSSMLWMSCDSPETDLFYRFSIQNNTDSFMQIYIAGENAEYQFPDTMLPTEKPYTEKLLPRGVANIDLDIPWQNNFLNLPSDTVSIYFILDSVYRNVDWYTVRDSYMIVKRLDLNKYQLERDHFYLEFP